MVLYVISICWIAWSVCCIVSIFCPARDNGELEKEVCAVLFGVIRLGDDGHSGIMFREV